MSLTIIYSIIISNNNNILIKLRGGPLFSERTKHMLGGGGKNPRMLLKRADDHVSMF